MIKIFNNAFQKSLRLLDSKKGAALLIIILTIISLIPLTPILKLTFLADDFDFLSFMQNLSLREQLRAFCSLGGVYFRPMGLLFWRFDYALWGENAFGYHLTNILLHLSASALLGLLAYRLTKQRAVGLGAYCLFLVFPLHVEALALPTHRFAVLSALFVALSLVLYLDSADKKRYLWSLVAAAAAYTSKEDAFVLPGLLLISDFLFKGKILTKRSIIKRFIPHLALATGIFILRALALSKGLGYATSDGAPINPAASLKSIGAAALWKAICVNLAPVNQLNQININRIFHIAIVTLVLLFILSLKSLSKNHRAFLFGVIWFFAAIAPVAPFFWTGRHLESSRYLYHATAGFILALSVIVFGSTSNRISIARTARFIIGLLVFSSYFYFTLFNSIPFTEASGAVRKIYNDAQANPIKSGDVWIYMGLPQGINGALLFPTDRSLTEAVLLGSKRPLNDLTCRVIRKDTRSLEIGDYPERAIPLAQANRIVEYNGMTKTVFDHTREIQYGIQQRALFVAQYRNLPTIIIPGGPTAGKTPMWPANDLKLIGPDGNGVWKYAATGDDPFFRSSLLRVNTLMVKEIIIKMALSPPAAGIAFKQTATLSFRSLDNRGYPTRNSYEFDAIADGKMREYRLAIGEHPGWVLLGTLAELRLDPMNRPGSLSLAEIAIVPY